MAIRYNAPVILTYTLISAAVMLASNLTKGFITQAFFTALPAMSFLNPLTYFRLFSHIIGHIDWTHLIGNFSYILLIGPLLEEKYGSMAILVKILITAFVTGLLNTLFFSTGLLGASGVVFMLILLASFANIREGEIPLTFLIVAALYLGQEILNSFKPDHVSQFAHILGGIAGAVFGFSGKFITQSISGSRT
ncbi:MAG: rhomboid family intramembrane serine protease [Chloroherpetonaceae bacterium]|nr:rhomboid family intramembrane serine protease [Chloroherpetonaceae bacterium]MCS7211729.1 rhomboid family intramembrane serine protease [Chloroherpetonaceae bacterium]MDW8018725.1 rhomboid family intramembrane serine protease [Chloroherpetonaceae bacterium]MDW8465909.1 rhomboid family intramembrane serine protease [Chloroherpetonaceae bacterium]